MFKHPLFGSSLSRRPFLSTAGMGLAGVAFQALRPGNSVAQEAKTDGPAWSPPDGRPHRFPRAKQVIWLMMRGGFSHLESFDPKPESPREVRGDFGVIPSRTPGLFVGELMPRIANLTDRLAVIRSMVTGDNAHSTSGYQMLTGVPHAPLSLENAAPGRPNDWPAFNAVIRGLCPPRHGLPSSIVLPLRLANNGGQDPWPGTDGGRAKALLDRIREDFSELPLAHGNGTLRATFSCGLASKADAEDSELLITAADEALLVAKRSGRNLVISALPRPVARAKI